MSFKVDLKNYYFTVNFMFILLGEIFEKTLTIS